MNRNLLLCSAAALLAWGCKDGSTAPPVATAVAVSPGTVSLNAVGATQVVHANVTDQRGKTMKDAAVTWSSSAAGVTVAGAGGDSAVVTAAANGAATVTATSGGASGSVTVQVTQQPASLQKQGGDTQTGAAGTALGAPLQVVVRDRLNAPIPGVAVELVAVGGGALSNTSITSDANGVATAAWTLGPVAGIQQQVTATAIGLAPVEFTATSVAGPPAKANAVAGMDQTVSPGATLAVAPRVVVLDAFNNPVPGVTVQFAVTVGGGSVTGATQTTGADGGAAVGSWTVGAAMGLNRLTATFPGTAVPAVVFTATAANVGTLTRLAGDNQGAMAGTAVPTAPSVVVRDGGGNPIPGLTVTFEVTAGGGLVANGTVVTNASGVASTGGWMLGPTAGPNTLTASVAGVTATPVSFRGVGCTGGGPGYTMTLCFTSTMTASQRSAFVNAAARWSAVITADLPDEHAVIAAERCGPGSPRLDMTFDDLVIIAAVVPIDGPGRVLGSAGPCFIRDPGLQPIMGLMRFDAADVATLESGGLFSAVILHEMGHVLGIGTMWSDYGLLQSPSSEGTVRDTWYSGANGIAGFNSIGGSSYTGGQKVPVENTGGPGTMNGHWRESLLGNELMTGFVNPGTNPMSLLTVRSLTDMGYTVNTAAADAFSVTLTVQGGSAPTGLRLHNDIWTGPLYTLDRQGRITRIRN